MRRLGLIGDVHAEDVLLEAALRHLEGQHLDATLCVGDVVDGRGDVDRCVELLVHHRVAVVRGNHDRWIIHDQMRDLANATSLDALAAATGRWLARLPPILRFDTVAGPLLLCHGLGTDDLIFVDEDGVALRRNVDTAGRSQIRARAQLGIEPDVRILVCGHTHARCVKRFGRLTLVNPGTLRSGDNPCFAVADLESGFVQFYELDDGGAIIPSERIALTHGSRST